MRIYSKNRILKSKIFETDMKIISQSILLISALLAAQLNLINDCDETFNYWEPLHYLHFDKGFMTWEYDPRYAIRSWCYMFVFYGISYILRNDHMSFFVRFRSILGFFHFISMSSLVSASKDVFHKDMESILVVIIAFSPAFFISANSFLPSSICMFLVAVSYSKLLLGNNRQCLFYIVLMTVLCWPFCGVFVLMPVFDVAYSKLSNFLEYLITGILQSILVLSISLSVDYLFYQKFVFVALNIVNYNIFSIKGPELYGVEPISYYIKVFVLHWGPLSILIPFGVLLSLLSKHKMRLISSLTSLAWLSIFFMQPHKEERFLYPVYPLLALEAAHSLFFIKSKISSTLYFLILAAFVIFSIMRTTALLPRHNIITLFKQSPPNSVICLGNEWHLFPTSFNLPINSKAAFIKDSFDGQLPYRFEQNAKDHLNKEKWAATWLEMKNVNDDNSRELDRFVEKESCDYTFQIRDEKKQGICKEGISHQEPFFGRVLRLPFQKLKEKSYFCLVENK